MSIQNLLNLGSKPYQNVIVNNITSTSYSYLDMSNTGVSNTALAVPNQYELIDWDAPPGQTKPEITGNGLWVTNTTHPNYRYSGPSGERLFKFHGVFSIDVGAGGATNVTAALAADGVIIAGTECQVTTVADDYVNLVVQAIIEPGNDVHYQFKIKANIGVTVRLRDAHVSIVQIN